MNYRQIKAICADIDKHCVSAYQGYAGALAEHAEMERLYNVVCSLSSHACAESVSDSARQLSYARSGKNIEIYTSVMNEAIQMLARGDNQSDVVNHFDLMVAKEYGRI